MPIHYPQEAALRDGRRVMLRPFTANDTEALYAFFLRLPEEVRRFAWDRIEDRAVVEAWGRNVDYDKVFPLLAVDGSKIVADATIHRRQAGPLRLVGRIKWLIESEYRGVGLGSLMIHHFIRIAKSSGLRHLNCMPISDLETDAIGVLKELGFEAYEIPGYGTDPDGNQHDMTKMVLRL